MRNEEELMRLKTRWYLFNDFMNHTYKEQNIYNSIKKSIDEAYENGKINILRSVNKDIDRDLKEMPLIDRIQLKKILYKELNEGTEDIEGFYRDKLLKVLAKKKITTSDEFELVQCYLKNEISIEKVEDTDNILQKLYTDYIKRNYRT
jgi:hypothetical protein